MVGETPISKITRAKWTGGVVQVLNICCANANPKFKPQSPKK
jgi:hypothetical protein